MIHAYITDNIQIILKRVRWWGGRGEGGQEQEQEQEQEQDQEQEGAGSQ